MTTSVAGGTASLASAGSGWEPWQPDSAATAIMDAAETAKAARDLDFCRQNGHAVSTSRMLRRHCGQGVSIDYLWPMLPDP